MSLSRLVLQSSPNVYKACLPYSTCAHEGEKTFRFLPKGTALGGVRNNESPPPPPAGAPGPRVGNRVPSQHSGPASLHSLRSVNTALFPEASQQRAPRPLPFGWNRSIFISRDPQLTYLASGHAPGARLCPMQGAARGHHSTL